LSEAKASALSPEDKKKALTRISQFVLREGIEETREELQENIIEMALFWGPMEEGVSLQQVNSILKKELYFIQFPDFVLTRILERLLNKKTVELRNEKYVLSEGRKNEVSRAVRENELIVNEINDLVLAKTEQNLGQKLLKNERNEVLTNFYSYLASLFIERSESIAEMLTGKKLGFSREMPRRIFERTLKQIESKELRKAYETAFVGLIENPTEHFLKFLFSISQNLICIQVLNLDPQCQKLEKEAYSEKVLFLDTNIIISLVCESDPLYKVATDLITLTSSLGARFLVTKRTIEEYLDVLEGANKTPKDARSANPRLTHLLKDPFIASYNIERSSLPSQTWEGYYYRMRQIESILREKFNTELYKEKHDEIEQYPFFSEIAERVIRCFEIVSYRPKKAKVAEHDAFHLLLVRELRKKETPTFLGPKHWFITNDSSLLCVDKDINKRPDYTDKTPSSMISALWLEMISPFLSASSKEKSLPLFALLLRREFATMPFRISLEDLLLIQGDWMQYDWLDEKDIEKILGEMWVRSYLDKAKAAQKEGEKDKVEKLSSIFAQKLGEELEKIKEEKIKLIMEERNKAIRILDEKDRYEIPELRRTVERRESTIEEQKLTLDQQRMTMERQKQQLAVLEAEYKKKWRTVTGILGIIIVLVGLLLLILTIAGAFQTSLHSVSLVLGCLGVGCILLLMTISYKQVSGKLP